MKTVILVISLLLIAGCGAGRDDPDHPYHNVGKRSSYTWEDYYWEGYDEAKREMESDSDRWLRLERQRLLQKRR